MTDKTKSKTFRQITAQQDIKDILNQSNATFKNNKGKDKQRHGGLTIKFSNDIDINDKPSKVVVNDKLNNATISDINEVSQIQIVTKEETTQNEINEEKSTDNFSEYTYNSVTILEDKKIRELRKEIIKIEKVLENAKEKDKYLNEELSTIRNNLFELELIELKLLCDDFNRLQKKKNNQIISDNDLKNYIFLKENIEEKEEKISKLQKQKKQTIKNIDNNYTKIKELNYKTYQLKQKLEKYLNELNIPAIPPALWIEKSDELVKLEKEYLKTVGQQNKEKIIKKMSVLKKEMKKIWDDKKVVKIYEEILPINNETYFIRTFVHFDNSISEQVMFFHNFNNNMKILIQTKNYQNINEYKNDFVLCEEILNNKNNSKCQFTTIKNFLKQRNNLKLKPTKTENILWLTSILLPTIAVIIGIFHLPSLIVGCIGLAIKTCTSFFSPKTKKVESWWYNKIFKNEEKKEKEKKEIESIIKNLTSNNIENKLQTQYDILKQELDNKKDKKVNDLMFHHLLNHNSNSIIQNSTIESENNQDFDSSIRNTVNHQKQQSLTSTKKIYHLNSIS